MSIPNKTNIIAGLFNAFAKETIDVSSTAKSLTSAVYLGSDGEYAKRAVITVETAQCRYWYDGSTPTSSVGHIVNPNSSITLLGTANIKNFKIIRVSADAKIQVTYEK